MNNNPTAFSGTAHVDSTPNKLMEELFIFFSEFVHHVPINTETASIAQSVYALIQDYLDDLQHHINACETNHQIIFTLGEKLKRNIGVFFRIIS